MKRAIFFSALLLIVIGCSKNEEQTEELQLSTEPPEIPQTVNFDINEDGLDDIRFQFGIDDVATNGTPGYYGSVYPMNGALLMLLSRDDGAYALEPQLNDIIKKEEGTSITWYPANWIIMFIDDTLEGLWPNTWTLGSSRKTNPYYLGIQVKEGETLSLGWLKLEIDMKTGKIELLDYELTSGDFLVINR